MKYFNFLFSAMLCLSPLPQASSLWIKCSKYSICLKNGKLEAYHMSTTSYAIAKLAVAG